MKIIGEIPARMGSKRVKQKNLRMLDGKPMVAYAIEAALGSSMLDEVYVNTESDILGRVATEYGAKFFKRRPELASDEAKQEEFNYDFIKNTGADVLVMINPVCPLVGSKDIDQVVSFFLENDYDTVISAEEIFQQAFCEGKPVNINPNQFLKRRKQFHRSICVPGQ